MAEDDRTNLAEKRLRQLYPSCEKDCTDGCKYGCLGWLHSFDPPSDESEPRRSEGGRPG